MIKLNKLIKYLLITLFIVMPILDTKFFFSRITTLGIVFIIFFILLLTLIDKKESRKNFKYIFIYYLLCLIYLIINYLHSTGFTSLFPNNFNYSLFREFTTIIKLTIPITLLYILKYNSMSKKEYINILKYWVIAISGSIIITNIFKISLSSYTDGTITHNIFEWNKDIYYLFTASKGFFVSANQEACILIMLLTIFIYKFIEKGIKYLPYLLLLTISMIMLGTRVSTLGGLLVLIFITLFLTIYKKILKQKQNKKTLYILIPIILWIILIPISPYSNRNIELSVHKNIKPRILYNSSKTTEEDILTIEKNNEKEEMMKYVDENHNEDRMPEWFYKEYYSYEYDPKFWYGFVKNNEPHTINYRMMEINIIKRIKEIDNRKSNILFGISNSRIQNVVNIERDIVLHYYAFGIIGMIILLIIYPILIIDKIIKFIKNKKDILNIINIFIIGLFILCSYLTGNILNFLTPLIPFILIISNENVLKKGK